jgi:DNA-binding NarL/FixJ family response regulator
MKPVRKLLLVEDEPMVAALLKETLTSAGFEIQIAHSAVQAKRIAKEFDPDIALIDINLGSGPSGVDLAFLLHKKNPGIALALLTKHPDLRTAGFENDDVPLGCGFIRKDMVTNSQLIVEALEEVIANQERVRQDVDPNRPFGDLTSSQIDVLRLVAQGFTNQEIARRRDTSVRAVEKLLAAVFNSLGIEVNGPINPRVEAVRKFISAAGTPDRP